MKGSSRARRAALLGAGLVVLAGGAWAIVAARHRQTARTERGTPKSGTPGAKGMEKMPGMDMNSGGSVRLTSAQVRQFGVTYGTVAVRPLTAESRTTGIVTVDETRLSKVTPKFGGFVERLYVNATGQSVRRGQPLLDIFSPDLLAAQQELLVAARLQHEIGQSGVPGVPGGTTDLVGAARRRLELWDISREQIDDVLRTGRARRMLTLYSPASGVVLDKKVVQGQSLTAGEELYTIADLSEVWVDVQVREAEAAAVRVGSGADIEVTGLPGRPLKGRVTYVYPTLDSASRAVRARVVVTNTGSMLKPGMYATVRLLTPSQTALTVPASAILRTGNRNVVFVDMGGGALVPRDVELGRSAGEYTEILAGLEPGQRVVTSAQFLLDSESNLGEVMRAMMSQMSSGDMGRVQDTRGMEGMPGMNGGGGAMGGMHEKGADMRGMKMPPAQATPPPRR